MLTKSVKLRINLKDAHVRQCRCFAHERSSATTFRSSPEELPNTTTMKL